MNKHCFQVIFSQSQQQFVVVSELAKSSEKSSAMPKVKVDDLFSLLFENLVSKENSQSETWQNNQLQAGKWETNSANGQLLLDATNVKVARWEGGADALELISRQDISIYKSVQTSGGAHGTLAAGITGVNGHVAYSGAKLNTAQVENPTSIEIGTGGMSVNIKNHTHLDGAIITSEADKENNHFQTGTLSTSDIQNHSELKTRSVTISGGTSGVNPMSALSLLGNKNESERSTTKAAIDNNIDIRLIQDPNAETTLNKLNRDTQNANQKVTKHDINEARETQELVKGIGEIAEKAYQIYTHSEREKVTEAKLALGKAQAQKASEEEIGKLEANLDRLQKEFDKNYGTGSKTKRAVDAVTAALQGLAAKDVGQAAVGLASPYLNAEIKKYTEGDTQANLIAHALLGAVEAAATGNNVLAGAAAGIGSEAAADFIVQTLYDGKSTKDLTEAEKQNVTFLSQLAGGLASGIIGDSTQSAAIGADIGKRAVENNFLSQAEYAELNRLMEKKVLTPEEAIRVQYLLEKDKISDKLLDLYQKNPDSLSEKERETLFKWVKEYGNVPMQLKLLETSAYSPQMKPDYSELKLRAQRVYNYSGSVEGRLSDSLATGLSMVGTGGSGVVVKGVQYAGNAVKTASSTAQTAANTFGAFATKYPNAAGMLTDGTVALGVHAGYKISTGQEINPYEAMGAFGGGALTRNHSLDNQVRINIGIATVTSLSKDPNGNDLGNAYFGAISSPVSGYFFNKIPVVGNAMGPVATEYFSDLEALQRTYNTLDEKLNKVSQQKEGSK